MTVTPPRPATHRPPDRLRVTGIEVVGHHGVFDFERRDGQPFLVDLTLGLDTAPAAASDDLSDTVDYGRLVDEVKAAVENDPVDLIETLAQRIADVCLQDERVQWTEVTLHKPEAPIAATFADVALTITRSRG
jgi:7,8-dihydroneopterin aldolase/epimerase/oxygenase